MTTPIRFAYTQLDPRVGAASATPVLRFTLGSGLLVDGVLDTGASINVLPYSIGVALGLKWDNKKATTRLGGMLSSPAIFISTQAHVATFSPVMLAFAWVDNDAVRCLLGQINFFENFNVCFFRSQLAFEVSPK